MVRESLPEGQALAPADFLRCAISYRSFSFIWCNPPYDYATGEEGRVESQFIERAVHLLADNGVLALVCPEDVAGSYQTVDFFQERFYEISAMPFPEEVRKYSETIILGCKRKQPNAIDYSGLPLGLAGKADGGPHRLQAAAGRAAPAVPQVGADRHRIGPAGGTEPAAVPPPAAGGQGELSAQAAHESRHRPSGHAVGKRPHRRADLPARTNRRTSSAARPPRTSTSPPATKTKTKTATSPPAR